MRSDDPDLHHARPLRGTGNHAPGEEGIHLMSDTTSAEVGTGPATPVISGYNDMRTTDESPERVALIQQATLAYLRTALGVDDGAWPAVRGTLAAASDRLGRTDSK
jgi:hypothetical protein